MRRTNRSINTKISAEKPENVKYSIGSYETDIIETKVQMCYTVGIIRLRRHGL